MLLRVRNLEVRYGRVPVLRGVSLDVNDGEFVGLLGPNGAGKSTLVQAIAGVIPACAGDVALESQPLLGHPPERIASLGVSLVPQGRRVFSRLTVRENLKLGAPHRRDGTRRNEEIERSLERFPALKPLQRTPAGRLSGGEQQQLVIARALVGRPRLLILDEPSLGLAPLIVDELFAVFQDLRQGGTAILLAEQHISRTLAAAHRSYVLGHGTVVRTVQDGDEISTESLRATYLDADAGPAA
jgi:branched-chain amino acid transport system ATP-binding protein